MESTNTKIKRCKLCGTIMPLSQRGNYCIECQKNGWGVEKPKVEREDMPVPEGVRVNIPGFGEIELQSLRPGSYTIPDEPRRYECTNTSWS